jgi:exonuclease III
LPAGKLIGGWGGVVETEVIVDKVKTKRKKRNRRRVRKKIRIAYLNIQGKTRSEWDNVRNNIRRRKWDIVVLTETHWREGQKGKRVEHYRRFCRKRTVGEKQGGGIAIFVHNKIKCWEWEAGNNDGLVDNESLWVTLQLGGIELAICGVYMATNSGVQSSVWNNHIRDVLEADMQQLAGEGKHILMLGDFNAHIAALGGKEDAEGRVTKDWLRENNLSILNTEQCCRGLWTWMRGESKSVIDFAVGDEWIKNSMGYMNIFDGSINLEQGIASDHNPMEIELGWGINKPGNVNLPPGSDGVKLDISDKTDWSLFREYLSELLEGWESRFSMLALEDHSIEQSYSELKEVIWKACTEVIGIKKPCRKSFVEMKLNRRLRGLKNRVHLARKSWKSKCIRGKGGRTRAAWQRVLNLESKFKVSLSRQQRRTRLAWVKRMEERGGEGCREFWKDLKMRNDESIDCLKTEKGFVSDPLIIKDHIANHFRKLGQAGPKLDEECFDDGQDAGMTAGGIDVMGEPVTEEDLEVVIRGLKNNKATGEDAIPNEVIKNGGVTLVRVLCKIFEAIRVSNYIPIDWRREEVQLIHKGGLKNDLNNYRGIALNSCIGKVFITILEKRLRQVAEKSNWIGEWQGGFREGRGVHDNLFILNTITEKARKLGEDIYLVFVDFRKAFDTICRDRLWDVLARKGLGGNAVNLIKNLYNGHARSVKTPCGKTDWMPCEKGVRQGCILSPLLFALYIQELGDLVQGSSMGIDIGGVKIAALAFADDVVLIANGKNELTNQVPYLAEFCKINEMSINEKKTKIMHLGTRKLVSHYFNGPDNMLWKIDETDVYKYLGAWVGNVRTWTHHMSKKKLEASWRVAKLKAVANDCCEPSWICNAGWKSGVKPSVLYAAEVIPYTQTWMVEVERVQSNLGRWLLGVGRYSSAVGIRGEMGWTSVQEAIAGRKIIFWNRIAKMDDSRWVKVALNWILLAPYISDVYRSLAWARDLLKCEATVENELSQNSLKRAIRKMQEEHWMGEVENSNALGAYPKDKLFGRVSYIGKGKISATMASYRLGCVDKPWDKSDICVVCSSHFSDTRVHILWECVMMPATSEEWRAIADGNESDTGKLRLILKNDRWENIRNIFLRDKLYKSLVEGSN